MRNSNISYLLGSGVLLLSSMQTLAANCTGLTTWQASDVYRAGDQVKHLNSAFEARWYSQNEDPQQNFGDFKVWKNLGACGGNQNPEVTLVTPAQGSVFTLNDSVVLSADAADIDGAVGQVEFFVDDVSVGFDNQAPYQVTWSAQLGPHVVSAVATDDQGAVSQASSATIEVTDGTINTPPAIELTSPGNNNQFTLGDTVSIKATATDQDGSISGASISINNLEVATFANGNISYNWVSDTTGQVQIKISAVDDKNASSNASVNINIASSNQGGCKGLKSYLAGQTYQTGELVSHNNRKYRCDVGGWCSSNAQWAYEPGAGQHWQDAWSDLGICAIAPEIRFVSPEPNSTLLQGQSSEVSIVATDADGTVAQLELYADQTLLGSFTSGTGSVNWQPVTLGAVTLSASATDNEGNVSTEQIQVNITDKPVVVDLTSPTAGTQYTLGDSVNIKAQAQALTGTVSSVEFYANGTLLGSDTTSPYSWVYTPAVLGTQTLTAVAKDSAGNQASSAGTTINVIDKPIGKTHKLIGYWHNFVNPAGCPIPLAQMSPAWDIIDIAFAENDRNSDGTVHFQPFEKDIRSNCPPIDPVQFKADMKALQAQGKVFVLSLGGAEGTITLNTDADEAKFVSSLTNIIQEWGFDGLDIDLESGSNLVHGSQIQARLPRALKQIEQNIGGNMVLTMAPEHPYVHGGMVAYTGIWGAYIPLIDALRDTLDLLHVQLYNNGGLPNPYEPGSAPEGSVNMMVAHAKMLIEGFDLADGTRFAPLRDDQVAIGLPSGPKSANSGQAPTANIIAALDCLTKGLSCGTIKPAFNYPKFGGVMTWSINWDKYDGYNFSKPIGDKLTQMNQGN
ncbi:MULTISPECIES: Ig-like domain-containing protein [Pseudoalteromonas]|uniref:chitinase n=1 Tax=Pseudoalteromonas obscura TaxID=3048491 RepID=A0ABT7EHF4_9GAMM|nr:MULTISPECIES: Ig-like domain-containing protein [Pseudoalteromonas]MBQ4836144.1 chitinase [Pseudoalteromonas luteoviolacea]MDK2594492.1 Ig-like domain-containing protein [Pseudoalteromonas sp. P94(2023)]